ncbi:hypothetical protein PMKS-000143 [Pichia membranifaciens]|uniref:Uncharacterized protein n=1 Tax=Pichia membranifaciens TaxID=4926 RepID=A0A1Q2YB23_9ASCO|nr:hypothetical protein PMKS-000143 [Pichia membranifaciens]
MEIASESSKKDDSPNSAISEQNLKNRLVDSELNKNKRQKTTQKSNQDLSTAVPVFTGDDPNDASNFFAQQAIQEQQEQQQEQQQQQQQQQHGTKNNTMIEQAKDLSAVDDISRNIDMQFMKGNLRAKNANSNLQVIPHQDLLNGALQSDDDDDDGDAEEEEDESVRKMLNESLSNANNNNSVNSSGSMRDQDNHNGQNFNAENTEIPMLNYSLISTSDTSCTWS